MFFEEFGRIPGSRAARKPPARNDPQRPSGPGGGLTPAPPAVEMTPEQERAAQDQYKMGSDILTPYECPIGGGKADVLETLIAYVGVLRRDEDVLGAHGIDPLPEACGAENLRRWWESGKDINIAAIRQDGWTLLDAQGDYAKAQQDLAENMGGFSQVWDDGHAANAQTRFNRDQRHASEGLRQLQEQGDAVRQVADHVQQALYAKRDQMGRNLSNLIGSVGNNGDDFEARVKSAIAIWDWQCPSSRQKDANGDPTDDFHPSQGKGVRLQDVLGYYHARYSDQSARAFRDKWYVDQEFWGILNDAEAAGGDSNAMAVLASRKPEELREMSVPQYARRGEGGKIYADDAFVSEDLKQTRDLIENSCRCMSDLHENMKQEIAGYYSILQTVLSGESGGAGQAGAAGGGAAGGAGGSGEASAAAKPSEIAAALPGAGGEDAGVGQALGSVGQALGSVGQALSSAGESLGQAASGFGSALGGGLLGLLGSIGQIIEAATQAAEQAPQSPRDDKNGHGEDNDDQDARSAAQPDQDARSAAQPDQDARSADDAAGAEPDGHGAGPDGHGAGPDGPGAEPKPAGTPQASHQSGASPNSDPGSGGRHAAPQTGPSLATAPAGMGHAPVPQNGGDGTRAQRGDNHGEFEVQAGVNQVRADPGDQGHLAGFD